MGEVSSVEHTETGAGSAQRVTLTATLRWRPARGMLNGKTVCFPSLPRTKQLLRCQNAYNEMSQRTMNATWVSPITSDITSHCSVRSSCTAAHSKSPHFVRSQDFTFPHWHCTFLKSRACQIRWAGDEMDLAVLSIVFSPRQIAQVRAASGQYEAD